MELEKELNKLNELKFTDVEGFESQYFSIREKFTFPNEVQLIDNYVHNMLIEAEKRSDAFIEEVTHILQQRKVSQMTVST